MGEEFDASDESFIVIKKGGDTSINNVAKWANDAAEELIIDYWENEKKEKELKLERTIKDVESYFPEFSCFKSPVVIDKRPILNSLMATTTFIIDPKSNCDIAKLVDNNPNMHNSNKRGTMEYRRQDMLSIHLSYTNHGKVSIFGPTNFDDIRNILSGFIEDLTTTADKTLHARYIDLYPLKIDNTTIAHKSENTIIDTDKLFAVVTEMKLDAVIYNGTITVALFPTEYPRFKIRVFKSGTINCMGRAPLAMKSIAFNAIDQIIAKHELHKEESASNKTTKYKKNGKSKRKQEEHMKQLISKKRKSNDESSTCSE
jgi:hypothetical protein